MKFVVEDTYNGYRLTMLDSNGAPRHHFDEEGGHGDIEYLYNEANSVWDRLRRGGNYGVAARPQATLARRVTDSPWKVCGGHRATHLPPQGILTGASQTLAAKTGTCGLSRAVACV